MAKPPVKRIPDDTIGEDVEPKFESKRGAKLEGAPKPKNALRVLVSGKIKTNRVHQVYKERVVDSDTGEEGWRLWWITEQSEYHGKEEIVRYNPRTQEEVSQGYDYTIPFTKEQANKLIAESYGGTKYYVKDGEDTFTIKNDGLKSTWLEDVIPRKATPISIK